MENKMYTKPQYKCGVCGKIYDSIIERAQCEVTCVKHQEEEARKAAELKKQEEQASRKANVDAQVKTTLNAIKEYTHDYGYYHYDGDISYVVEDFLPLKILHHFF